MKLYDEAKKTIKFQQSYDPLLIHTSQHVLSLILDKSRSNFPQKILDIGCGVGRTAILLSQKGYDVTGVDIEKKVIAIANQEAKRQKIKARFIVKDITKSFEQNTYDFVICQEVIEHLKNYEIVIKNAFQALKKGGYLILSTPHSMSQWSILDDYANHLRRYSIREFNTILKDFTSFEIFTIGFPFMRLTILLYNWLIKKTSKKHSSTSLLQSDLYLKYYIPILSLLLKVDDLFNFLPLGTTIIVVAKK